jgi:pyruvate dehydrogenase E1 component alpha subunit
MASTSNSPLPDGTGVIASTQPVPDLGKAPPLSSSARLEWYRLMYLTRKFEERAYQSYQTGLIGGFCHLYNGQEALAAGCFSALDDSDPVITAYRDHAHGLMRGVNPGPGFAELYGRATGVVKGKGGSMHFFNVQRQMWGGHGIVGGQTPLGLGIAFATKYLDEKNVCFTFLGDGAVNQGSFHESLNIAQLWKIPVVFVVENNMYSMGTSVERHAAPAELYKRAAGYDMLGVRAVAQDFDAVREIAWTLAERARTENLPAILELMTYRYRGHSMSDPQTYRSKDEIDEYRKHDPVEILRERILSEGAVSDKDLEALEDNVRREVLEAHEWALASPYPQLSEIYTDIYA